MVWEDWDSIRSAGAYSSQQPNPGLDHGASWRENPAGDVRKVTCENEFSRLMLGGFFVGS